MSELLPVAIMGLFLGGIRMRHAAPATRVLPGVLTRKRRAEAMGADARALSPTTAFGKHVGATLAPAASAPARQTVAARS